jgi:hypothetical protein
MLPTRRGTIGATRGRSDGRHHPCHRLCRHRRPYPPRLVLYWRTTRTGPVTASTAESAGGRPPPGPDQQERQQVAITGHGNQDDAAGWGPRLEARSMPASAPSVHGGSPSSNESAAGQLLRPACLAMGSSVSQGCLGIADQVVHDRRRWLEVIDHAAGFPGPQGRVLDVAVEVGGGHPDRIPGPGDPLPGGTAEGADRDAFPGPLAWVAGRPPPIPGGSCCAGSDGGRPATRGHRAGGRRCPRRWPE